MWIDGSPDWPSLLEPELMARLHEWARFFNAFADEETGLFGTEQRRKWFDLEGIALRDLLIARVGDRFEVVLDLWF